MIPYILHVTVIITACFLFYKLLLQNETFFRLNRWTLLVCVGVSFALPLLPVPQQWSWNNASGLTRLLSSPSISALSIGSTSQSTGSVVHTEPNTIHIQPNTIHIQPNATYIQPNTTHISSNPASIQPNPAHISPNTTHVQPNTQQSTAAGSHRNIQTSAPITSPDGPSVLTQAGTFRDDPSQLTQPGTSSGESIGATAVSSNTLAHPTMTSAAAPSLLPKLFQGLYWLYLFGVIVFGGNLLLQIIVLLYQSYTRPVVQDGPFRIVETTGDRAPCSFGYNIFINSSKYDWDTYSQILLHEKIHASGRHTIDILLAEILIVLQWFNPFAWFYRKEVENNLEFLTDQALLQTNEVEPSVYQLSLLKVAAPNIPYNITTNYNQSLLKRRIIMMNSKRSSLHTIWKYFFLLPLLTCLVCALNKPMAFGQPKASGTANASAQSTASSQSAAGQSTTAGQSMASGQSTAASTSQSSGSSIASFITTADTTARPDRREGSWFATTKGDKLCFELKGDKDDHTWSNNTCISKSEFSSPPGVGKTEFRLVREAGTIYFTGQFDGQQGYGHYSFKQDDNYVQTIRQKGIAPVTDDGMLAFFLLNIKNDYIDMLRNNGYPHVSKNNLIAMSAMHIDQPYIKSWREMGYTAISENDIIAVKAMNIDKEYIEDLRKAGYANLKVSDLLAFKAQGIDGQYVTRLNQATAASPASLAAPVTSAAHASPPVKASAHAKAPVTDAPVPAVSVPVPVVTPVVVPIPANDIIAFKSLNIDSQYLASLKAAGYDNVSMQNLISMRSMGIDAAYIKSFEAVGYKDIPVQSLVAIKSMGITPDFINAFRNIGYKDISAEQLPALKSLGITPDFVKSFRDIGYKDISLEQLTALKSRGITPEFVKSFRSIGYTNISLDQLPALKSMGVTPAYVTEMKGKGFVSNDLNKYIQLKSAFQ